MLSIMKRLLLILSGILFLCSCEDMEPTMQGTLERLEDNSATIKTSLPDSISSNDYEILTFELASNKDAFLNTPLKADGKNYFIYAENAKVELSKVHYPTVSKIKDSYGGSKFLIIALMLILTFVILGILCDDDKKYKTEFILCCVLLSLFLGTNCAIRYCQKVSVFNISTYGKLLIHTQKMSVIEEQGVKKIYYDVNCSECCCDCSLDNFEKKSDQVGIIRNQEDKNFLIISQSKESLEAMVKCLNQENQKAIQNLNKWFIWTSCIQIVIVLFFMLMVYVDENEDKIREYLQKRKEKKKKSFHENLSEDGKQGHGSF